MPSNLRMAHSKQASAMVYIQEELSDARLRCDELKHLVVQAMDLINGSSKKDHFYAVAGDVIHAAPQALLKLERALGALSMAVNKMDYEEQRQLLRPEKVDELERVLDEVRVRVPRRTGQLSFTESDSAMRLIAGSAIQMFDADAARRHATGVAFSLPVTSGDLMVVDGLAREAPSSGIYKLTNAGFKRGVELCA